MSITSESLTVRQSAIMDRLNQRGFISTSELAETFSISEMTVRRDTRQLEARGVVRVVHGGVSLAHTAAHNSDFAARARVESMGKRAVAQACLNLVGTRDAIIIDAGTTAFEIVNELPHTFEGTVVTNSVPAIQRCLHVTTARTICLGGELILDSQAFTGAMTIAAVEGLRAQTAFIGVSGVHDNAFYVERDVELSTKLALMNSAEHVVIVATHDKMNRSALIRMTDFSRVDCLVTDTHPPTEIVDALFAASVELIVAPTTETSIGTPDAGAARLNSAGRAGG